MKDVDPYPSSTSGLCPDLLLDPSAVGIRGGEGGEHSSFASCTLPRTHLVPPPISGMVHISTQPAFIQSNIYVVSVFLPVELFLFMKNRKLCSFPQKLKV